MIEKLKLEYTILRDKLLLFSGSAGGSFLTLIKGDFSLLINSVLTLTFLSSFVGIIVNLHKISKIQNKLKELNNDWICNNRCWCFSDFICPW